MSPDSCPAVNAAPPAPERLGLLYRILSEMNSANIHIKERDALFEAACRILLEGDLFRMAWIGLIDRQGGRILPVAHAGFEDGYLERMDIDLNDPERGNGPSAIAAKTGQPVACNDVARDPHMKPWRDEALRRGYRSSIVLPLTQAGQTIGVFTLYSRQAGILDNDVIALLRNLADNISFTLDFMVESQQRATLQDELKALSTHLQTALENERTHIARELHDELGQSMTALRFDLKWLDKNIAPEEAQIHERLRAMNDLVGRTVDAIRRISEDLRPGILDDLGLAAAIEHHAAKFSAQTGIACDLSMNTAEFDLDDPVATTLFRIVQEALTNVARHSGADRVTVRLQALEDRILLIIQDNGRGLPPERNKKSYGLLGMRERVKMAGGTLDVFNEKDAGARIEACIPKRVEAAP